MRLAMPERGGARAHPLSLDELAAWTITGPEVECLFKIAAKRPPYPDAETCDILAIFYTDQCRTWLRCLTAELEQRPKKKRRRDAINLLLAAIQEERNSWGEWVAFDRPKKLSNLEASLNGARKILGTEVRNPTLKNWHVPGFAIMDLTVGILVDVRGRAGSNRNSVAAHFTELLLKRMGVHGAEREAIAQLHARWCAHADRLGRVDGSALTTNAPGADETDA